MNSTYINLINLDNKKDLLTPDTKRFANPAFDIDKYNELQKSFKNDYLQTWANLARNKLSFKKDFTTILDDSDKPNYKWFSDGGINVAYNCVEQHAKNTPNAIALICESDNGDSKSITYEQLNDEVNKCANMLKDDFGVQKGDRVILYLPMIKQSIVAMLSCNKIGAIHSIVFGGFSANALRDRIQDTQAKLIITADGAYRKAQSYMLKPIVDEALKQGCECVKSVCVIKRNNQPINLIDGRDFVYNELIEQKSNECKCEILNGDDTMFILYTSGSTGKPKGIAHSVAGYLLWTKLTCEWVFDLKKEDIYWCSADIGWITGHTYSVYGPLSVGATTVIFEGVPTYPNAARFWDIIQKHKVTQFYTAPTALRMVKKLGEREPEKYDLSSLRVLGSVGEPIDSATWQWYYEAVGKKQCPIVDTWWQTETGGNMIAPIPCIVPIKPACATLPLPGIEAEVLNEDGSITKTGEKGYLCITKPWPSMLQGVWGDSKRFKNTYFGDIKYNNEAVYFSGDGAMKDENGYITITGRVDDVINKNGHRIGTAEIEDAINFCPLVSASGVVSIPDAISGEAIFAFVVLKEHLSLDDKDYKNKANEIKNEINKELKERIGAIAICDEMVFVKDIPKTRSGKNMRRLLRSIAKGEDISGDISTLENPDIIKDIQLVVKNYKKANNN